LRAGVEHFDTDSVCDSWQRDSTESGKIEGVIMLSTKNMRKKAEANGRW
jgi:hypothetical protein